MGGGGKHSANQTVAYYYAPVAMAICEGPIVGIKQIWAGGNLIYADDQPVLVTNYQGGGKKQGPSTSTTYQTFGSSTVNGVQAGGSALGPWTCYLGQPGQPADPTIGEGVGYEGIAYIVFNPMNLGPSGTVPPLTFEVVTAGALNPPSVVWSATAAQGGGNIVFDDNGNPVVTTMYAFQKHSAENGSLVKQFGNPDPFTANITQSGAECYFLDIFNAGIVDITTGSFASLTGNVWTQSGNAFVTDGIVCLYLHTLDNANLGSPLLSYFYTYQAGNSGYSVAPFPPDLWSAPNSIAQGVLNLVALQNSPTLIDGLLYFINGGLISCYSLPATTFVSSTLGGVTGYCFDDNGGLWASGSDSGGDYIAQLDPTSLEVMNRSKAELTMSAMIFESGMLVGIDGSGNYVTGYATSVIFMNLEGSVVGSVGLTDSNYTLAKNSGFIYAWNGGILVKILPPNRTITIGTMDLPAAVTILCNRAGIESFDVSELPDAPVNFVRQDTTNARTMLNYLSKAYFFSMVDSGGTLRFVPYGLAPVASIPLTDLGYGKVTPNAQTPYTASRVTGTDLPRSVKIRYTSPAQLWNAYEQIFALESYDSGKEVTLSLPLILDDTSAYNIASIACTLPHAERMQYSFTTSLKWLALEPGDVVSLPFGVCRILSVKMGTGSHDGLTVPVLEFTACIDGMNALAGAGYAVPALPNYTPGQTLAEAIFNPPPLSGSGVQTTSSPAPHPIQTAPQITQTVPNAGVAKLAITEPPPLSQSDTGMRFMVGAYSTGNVFPGAGIFQSTDGGTTYDQIDTVMGAEVTGYANSVLPAPTGPYNEGNFYTWDTFSTVDICGLSPGFDLSSLPDINVLNGGNLAMLGSELIQFAEATLNTDSLGNPYYTLSRLLRGRRGTEWAMGSHQLGEKFYLIPGALQDQTYTAPQLNNPALYKVAMMGSDLGQLPATSYEPSGASLMQWAPCDVLTSKDASGDWTISWTPRARYNGDFASGFTPYLDPDTIGWSVDILSGTTVKRTIAVPLAQTAPWQTVYTAAMQQADGFSAGETGISFNLYQLSQSIGRGYPASSSTGAAPSEI